MENKPVTDEQKKKETDQLLSALDALKGRADAVGGKAARSSETLRKVVAGEAFNSPAVRNQLWVIVIAVLFIIVYVAVRYQCQQDMIAIDKLENELKDAQYRALSSSSELTEKTRETHILERLKNSPDSMLHIPELPPYIIQVPEADR